MHLWITIIDEVLRPRAVLVDKVHLINTLSHPK